MMESFWGTVQLELLDSEEWPTGDELANAIFERMECWYNPATFETQYTGPGQDH